MQRRECDRNRRARVCFVNRDRDRLSDGLWELGDKEKNGRELPFAVEFEALVPIETVKKKKELL